MHLDLNEATGGSVSREGGRTWGQNGDWDSRVLTTSLDRHPMHVAQVRPPQAALRSLPEQAGEQVRAVVCFILCQLPRWVDSEEGAGIKGPGNSIPTEGP